MQGVQLSCYCDDFTGDGSLKKGVSFLLRTNPA